jgi:hypothetical protein
MENLCKWCLLCLCVDNGRPEAGNDVGTETCWWGVAVWLYGLNKDCGRVVNGEGAVGLSYWEQSLCKGGDPERGTTMQRYSGFTYDTSPIIGFQFIYHYANIAISIRWYAKSDIHLARSWLLSKYTSQYIKEMQSTCKQYLGYEC